MATISAHNDTGIGQLWSPWRRWRRHMMPNHLDAGEAVNSKHAFFHSPIRRWLQTRKSAHPRFNSNFRYTFVEQY